MNTCEARFGWVAVQIMAMNATKQMFQLDRPIGFFVEGTNCKILKETPLPLPSPRVWVVYLLNDGLVVFRHVLQATGIETNIGHQTGVITDAGQYRAQLNAALLSMDGYDDYGLMDSLYQQYKYRTTGQLITVERFWGELAENELSGVDLEQGLQITTKE